MANPFPYRKIKGKSKIITIRLDESVYNQIKKNHPDVSAYLRQRITYDVTRSHKRVRNK